MKMKKLLFIFVLSLLCGSFTSAQDHKYIGSAKCKMCHNKPNKGEQYNKWKAASHSKAMASLKSEESLAYAKEHGIADPSTDKKCISCHSTAGSIDASLKAGIKISEGVSCESCHGPGSVYKSKSIMTDQTKALANGLILPTKEVCVKCHNKDNPFHKPFDFDASVAKIAHPDPTLTK